MTKYTPHKGELLSTQGLVELIHLSKRFREERRISGDTPSFLRISARAVRYRWRAVVQWIDTMKHNNTSDQGDNAQGKGAI